MAVLAQALNDHLEACNGSSETTNRRLGRIEKILIGVAGSAILQLLAAVAGMATYIVFHH